MYSRIRWALVVFGLVLGVAQQLQAYTFTGAYDRRAFSGCVRRDCMAILREVAMLPGSSAWKMYTECKTYDDYPSSCKAPFNAKAMKALTAKINAKMKKVYYCKSACYKKSLVVNKDIVS